MGKYSYDDPGFVPRSDDTWIQTASGRQFWPMAEDPGEIDVADIAHALSHACRYAGHTREFYSVAQHSVLVSHHVPGHDALWGLMHDATEAYMGDMVRPLKGLMPAFEAAEERLMRTIAARLNLPWPIPASVKAADDTILAAERRDLMVTPPVPWKRTRNIDASAVPKIVPWPPPVAKEAFIRRYVDLTVRCG